VPPRRPVQAKLTPEAADAWDRFLADHGRTFTSIIEAIGLDLAAGGLPLPRRIIDAAQEIDVRRRSRRA